MMRTSLSPSRRSQIAPFYVMEIAALAQAEAAKGHQVLFMNVGEPAGGAPLGARCAAAAAIVDHNLGYTLSPGLPALRQRIATHYKEWYRVPVMARNVLVVNGASGGFLLAFISCFDAGDRVGVTEPGYPCYRNTLEALGVTSVGIALGPETGYRLTVDAVKRVVDSSGALNGLVIASPSNPTGTVLTNEDLRALTTYCQENSIRLIADEIYHGLTFGGPASTALQHDPETIILNSFSKYFGMTGWRLGWIVAPESLMPTLDRLAQNLSICAPHVSQIAGLAAFDCHGELTSRIDTIQMKRQIVIDGLESCGLHDFAPPDGAFYVYVDVSSLTSDSLALSKQWLSELHVAATSGIDFDPIRGNRFIRLSYAGPETSVREAMQRISDWVRSHR